MHEQIQAILESLKKDSNYRTLQPQRYLKSLIQCDSKKWLLNLASNDYLGLTQNSEFNARFLDSTLFRDYCSFSSSSSRLLSGNSEIYAFLESHLKNLFCKEALLFNSGYHANVGVIGALGKLQNLLFVVDKSMHASCLDGLKDFKPLNFKRFAHNDTKSLREILKKNAHNYESVVILSEGLFSMEGDFAPLEELVALKEEFSNVYLYLDEAHSIGSFGRDGLGVCAHFGLLSKIDFLVLTFGKSLASMGACVLCGGIFKEYLMNTARSLIYSTALPPVNVARSMFAFLEIPHLLKERERLKQMSLEFKRLLQAHLNLEILGDYNIITVVLGSNAKAVSFANALLECGYFAPAIKTPTLPKNRASLRFSLCANMEFEILEKLPKILQELDNAYLSES